MECPMRWYYNYGLSLRPIGLEKHFHVGSYWHELAHFYYELLKSGMELGSKALNLAMQSLMMENFEKAAPEFRPIYIQVHLMFDRYLKRRTESLDRNIEILEVEKELRIEVEPGLDLMGIADLIYVKKGRLIIRDHKTGANASRYSAEKMQYESQTWFYACLYWKMTGQVPDIEISWINSKTDYVNGPPAENARLFRNFIHPLEESDLEGYWQYILRYVNLMRSVDPIRNISGNCSSCRYREPCILSMRGFPVDRILEGSFKVVPRGYEFSKFTEVSQQDSSFDLSFE